jgi:hypothetical protein
VTNLKKWVLLTVMPKVQHELITGRLLLLMC